MLQTAQQVRESVLMSRARAWVAAVPPGVWTAVAGLVLLASFAIAAVIGAGLTMWHGAVGGSTGAPTVVVAPPQPGTVVVPGRAPARRPATGTRGGAGGVGAGGTGAGGTAAAG